MKFTKIVCFDPTYSNYFNDLSKVIDSVCNHKLEKECLTFNYANKLYLKDFKVIIPKIVDSEFDEDYAFVGNITSLSNITSSRSFSELKSDILVYKAIENYIRNNQNALYLIYNDLRWNHAFAIDILKKFNCNYFVFERGVFRPYTTTMDRCGANACSYFSEIKYEDTVSYDETATNKNNVFEQRRNKENKLLFAIYFILKESLAFLYNKNVKVTSKNNFKKTFSDYIKLLLKHDKNTTCHNSTTGKPYVFVPLQLGNDTQTLINSEFKSTKEFIEKIVNDYRNSKVYKELDVIFKVHPLDTNTYDFPQDVSVSTKDTSDLVANSEYLITINSTVGFEACENKIVYCFGDSFYTKHGVINKLNPKDNAFDHENPILPLSGYKAFVLSKYQVPGSVYNYTDDDLRLTAQKILHPDNY